MSSELSGRYRLELEQKRRIENDCRAALRACQNRRAEEKAQWQRQDAAWEQKSAQAAGQAAAGRAAAEEQADKKMWALRRRLAALKERCSLLNGADELRAQLQMAEAMLTDRTSCSFVEARLDWLEQEATSRSEQEAFTAQQAAESPVVQTTARRAVRTVVQQEFVPLTFAVQQAALKEQSPWAQFCGRVQQMMERAGDNPLPEMTVLAERVRNTTPARQNERMLQERELLVQLERQASRMEQMRRSSAEQQDEQQQYRFLCQKLGLTEKAYRGEELRRENTRLFALWCEQEEENYIQQSLREAFEQAGIPFSELEDPRRAAAELSDNMRVEMTRDALGTFYMEAYGVADSAQETEGQKERMVAQCRHFCKQFPQIVDFLREKGILLEDIGQIEPAKTTLHVRACPTRRRTVDTGREREAQSF